MSDHTAIQWTDATWNPTRGCSIVSPGCINCYAMKMAHRFDVPGGAYEGLTKMTGQGAQWSGKVTLADERTLEAPLHWRKPRRIFVDSMSDLFHDDVPAEWIDRVFAVMALTPQHTYQVLTKRPERMHAYLTWNDGPSVGRDLLVEEAMESLAAPRGWHSAPFAWPLPNVWLGTSVEDQQRAVSRIPLLLDTPAVVRFISAEPLLGPLDLSLFLDNISNLPDYPGVAFPPPRSGEWYRINDFEQELHWVIVGGESGPKARPFDIAWARSLREQCREAGVAFFYKQGGASNRCEHDGHGGHMDCFPADLRVRGFPDG